MSARGDPNPPVPEFYQDGRGWITGYLVVHMLSSNSYRYAYLLWLIILSVFICVIILHWTGLRKGYLGAIWTKWAVRRRTWRKTTKHPIFLPSNGQILCLTLLPIAAIMLCFIGPDYISPTVKVFGPARRDSQYWDINMYTKFVPTYTIDKNWWTAGSRIGLIVFSLFPVCVLFALKAPPFAIFAIRFTTQLYFDKLAWLHRWTGRFIWLAAVGHVALWSVQLAKDVRPNTQVIVYNYAWIFPRFLWGWVAFGCLTLLFILSFPWLRGPHYETFYFFHVALAAGTLVFSALHHPPVATWCAVALGLWGAERIHRLVRWLYMNALITKPDPMPAPMHRVAASPQDLSFRYPPSPVSISSTKPFMASPGLERGVSALMAHSYCPPPGYAHAELISGATVRLTYTPPKPLAWAPGQHFLINVPSVSHFTTHPFTVASVCDEQAPVQRMVFLVRCKNGWTKDLWHHVAELSYQGQVHAPGEKLPPGTIPPQLGILCRMYVDGPFGSSVRASWGEHSTVLIVVGGSGVSFGLSILEYLSFCLAGRQGRHLGSRPSGLSSPRFVTQRVRFIWLVREFAHLQWCASTLRRCQEMAPRKTLQIDLFVTNFALPVARMPGGSALDPFESSKLPPRGDEMDYNNSEIDLSYYPGNLGNGDRKDGPLPDEGYAMDLTEFDGDNDVTLPGEDVLNRRVGKVSVIRRAHTRRVSRMEGRQSMPRKHRNRLSETSTDGLLTSDWASVHSRESTDYDIGRIGVIDLDGPSNPPSRSSSPGPGPGPPRPNRLSRTPGVASPLHVPSGSESSAAPLLKVDTNNIVSMSRPPTPNSMMLPPSPTLVGADLHPRLRVDDQELRDVSIISEFASPGKPRLGRILGDEVEKARSSILVACCGPTSLNAIVRKSVSENIDPQRVRKGDGRGFITLVSEDFAY